MNRLFFSLCASAVGCAFALQFPATAIAQDTETVLHSFGSGTDGANPYSNLLDVAGTLYGTTEGAGANFEGTVFEIDPKTGAESVLYSFGGGTDGEQPNAGLIDVKGTLYGTTTQGGAYGVGTVFSLDPKTGAEKVVYSFCSQPNCADGGRPLASLIDVKNRLYGTTAEFGAIGYGTVFSVNPRTGAEAVVYSFQGGTDGGYPAAGLIDVKDTLYGTTASGANSGCGGDGCGTVFSVDPGTGVETVLHAFGTGTDGASPFDSLLDVKGTLYGTTSGGGTDSRGTVFKLDPKTGAETVLYSFSGSTDGENPRANLIDVKGKLYGTTEGGGADFGGMVFELDPKTGAETVLYAFCSQENCADGAVPSAGLIDVNGTLYGTTEQGGAYGNYGTVFALTKP